MSGELSVRDYTKKDGTQGYSVELNVPQLDLPERATGSSAPADTGSRTAAAAGDMDELRF